MSRLSTLSALICATLAFVYGCVPIPVPIITADRPLGVFQQVPAEFAADDADVFVLVTVEHNRQTARLDEPLFLKGRDMAGLDEKLERTSLFLLFLLWSPAGGAMGPGGEESRKVHEICLIASSGKTMSVVREDSHWTASSVGTVDSSWRDSFLSLLSERRPATLLPIWKSSPCTAFDWASLNLLWNDEQRAGAIEFLRKLPLQKTAP